MKPYDYKEEIIASRKGFLGGSDGAMLARIAKNGCVQKSDHERLAIVKGLWQKENITTVPMRYGDYIENQVYNVFLRDNPAWKNNLRYESKKYKRDNVGLLVHIDFSLQRDDIKTLRWIECKATTSDTDKTINDYFPQLWIEYNLGMEMANELGYNFEFRLIHYQVGEMPDSDSDFTFDPARAVSRHVVFPSDIFNIKKAMDVINDFLPTMTEFYRDDIEYGYLPAPVQEEFNAIATVMQEIKAREDEVATFKAKMYDFLLAQDIKSIKCPFFTISRVDESISIQFDSKKYKAEHPRLYKKYTKEVKKKGYALIKLKEDKK